MFASGEMVCEEYRRSYLVSAPGCALRYRLSGMQESIQCNGGVKPVMSSDEIFRFGFTDSDKERIVGDTITWFSLALRHLEELSGQLGHASDHETEVRRFKEWLRKSMEELS